MNLISGLAFGAAIIAYVWCYTLERRVHGMEKRLQTIEGKK
jgi:hypothetical protein